MTAAPAPAGHPPSVELPRPDGWPAPMAPEAFTGIAGDFVRAVAPHTESDPVALLVQFLAAAGCAIGPGPYLRVGADRHEPRIFAVLVGETSRGRKGSSLGWVRHVVTTADPAFAARWQGGLSTGEGLIHALRDEVREWKPGRGGRPGAWVVMDPGIDDKRLFAFEGEYSRPLLAVERTGNTLCGVLRLAWDGAPLRVMTKSNGIKADSSYMALIGHITADELRRRLGESEAANGFGNRHLFFAVRRARLLPDGGRLRPEDLAPLAASLRERLLFARSVGEVRRSPAFAEAWGEVYPLLTEERPGMFGALTARSEAQVLRLTVAYALLDESAVLEPRHLLAGLAVWKYAEDSVRFIFGDRLGDAVADEILEAVRRSPRGLTRTEIRDLFGRHQSAGRLAVALELLQRHGLATVKREETAGRPTERWVCTRDISDQRGG